MRRALPILLLLSLTLIGVRESGLSQQSGSLFEDYLPPSPETSSLVQFSESAVNLSTGTAQISIPLFSIRSRYQSWPFRLNYQSEGVRTQEDAGVVGLSWSHNMGVISRTIMDLADEHSSLGYLQVYQDYDPIQDQVAAAEDGYDLQPDIFNFSFYGYSGKFILSPSGEVIQLRDSDLKIINNNFDSWTIISPEGMRFEFSYQETGSYTGRNGRSIQGITAWYLTSVTDYDDRELMTFGYTDYNYINERTRLSQSQFVKTNNPNCTGCVDSPTDAVNLVSSYGSQTLLSAVTSEKEFAWFYYGDRLDHAGQRLDSIQLFRAAGSAPTVTRFEYAYFGPNDQKLKLERVTQQAGNIQIPAYEFEYHGQDLRDRMGKAFDHWGFQSNKTGRSFMPPTDQSELEMLFNGDQCFGFPDRDPDTSSVLGMLTKIEYPTGWYEHFEYENHDYGYIGDIDQQVAPNHVTSSHVLSTQPAAVSSKSGISIWQEFPVVKLALSSTDDPDCSGNINGHCYARVTLTDNSGQVVYDKLFSEANDGIFYLSLDPGAYTMTLYRDVNADDHEASVTLYQHNYQIGADVNANIAGGCRIRSITTPDGTRSYVYRTTDNYSSGVLTAQPRYSYTISRYVGCGPQSAALCTGINYVTNSYISPLSGSHISYLRVEEYLEDSSRVDYHYDFSADVVQSMDNPPVPITSRSHLRGDLIKSISYRRSASGTYIPVREDSTYFQYQLDTILPAYSVFMTRDFGTPADFMATSNFYEIVAMNKTTAETHLMQDGVSTVSTYQYQDDTLRQAPTSMIMTNSDGIVHETHYEYTSTYPAGALRDSLMAQYRMMPAWQTIQIAQSDTINGTRSDYAYWISGGIRVKSYGYDQLPDFSFIDVGI